jgi:hypothetical protein
MVDSEGGLLGSDRIRIQNGHAKNYIPTVKKKKNDVPCGGVGTSRRQKSNDSVRCKIDYKML